MVIILLALKYLINVTEPQKAKIDATSVVLSTIGFGLVLYCVSTAGRDGWNDAIVLASAIAGAVIIVLFCLRQIKSADPLLNLTVFKNRTFTMTSLINILVTMMMYADMTLLPIYLQDGRGFTAFDAGLLLLPGAIINALLAPVTGRLFDRFGAKPLFIIGLLFIIPSMWVITDLSSDTTYLFLMIRAVFLRIGLSFITMPLNKAGLNALPKELITHGTAVNNTVRQIAGSIGTAIVITVFSTQTSNYATALTLEQPDFQSADILKLATASGTSDAYYFMMILAITAFIITLFTKTKTAEKSS